MKRVEKWVIPIIGGIISGLVASIPWILAYIYLNFIIAVLAIPIALGVNFGYQKFGGKASKHLSTIISITTLLIVVFVALVAIPLLVIFSEGYDISFYNLRILYQDSAFVQAVLTNGAISLIFAFIGIRSVTNNTKAKKNNIDNLIVVKNEE